GKRPDTLWLVRHGESTWNALGLVQGHAATPALTARGQAQAEQLAEQLAATLAGVAVAALYSSDLGRAVQTAGPLAARLGRDVVRDQRLRERSFGEAEGTPSRVLPAAVAGIEGERVIDADATAPGGESVRDLYRRVAGFADDVLAPMVAEATSGDVVVVTHGGVVRALAAWLDGIDPDDMPWGPVGNGLVVSRPLAAARRPSMSGS
ncbi:MAG TPA: histidine phosphatase family protein, partial [Acidimicrobiales bacterium]